MNSVRFLIVGVAVFLSGCGSRGLPVTGTVNLGGVPLRAGTIAFEPAPDSGTVGSGAVENIRDGKFEVKTAKGLSPGRYVVRVSPVAPGSGEDLRTAPPQFKIWETMIELKSAEPLTLDVPANK